MRYWVYQDSRITGPFDRGELASVPGLSADSLVCPEEAGAQENDWRCLESIPELASLCLVASGVALASVPEQAPPSDAFSSVLGREAFMWEGQGYPGEWMPGKWDDSTASPLDSEYGANALLEAERLRNNELEGRLAELKGQLQKYERRQDEILERLNEKDHLLSEREKTLEQTYLRVADLEQKLARPAAPSPPPVLESAPRKDELLERLGEKDRLLAEREKSLEDARLRVAGLEQKLAQPAAPARQSPDIQDGLLAVKDREIAELQARIAQLEDAIVLAPQAAAPPAQGLTPARLAVPAQLDIPDAAQLKPAEALSPIEFVPPLPPESAVSLPADVVGPIFGDAPHPESTTQPPAPAISLVAPPDASSPVAPTDFSVEPGLQVLEHPQTMVIGETPSVDAAIQTPASPPAGADSGLERLSYTPIPLSDDPRPWTPPPSAAPVQLPQTIVQSLGLGAGRGAPFTPAPEPFQDLMGNVPGTSGQASVAAAPSAVEASGFQSQPRRKQRGFLLGLVLAMACLAAVVMFFLKDPRQVVQMVSMDPARRSGEGPTARKEVSAPNSVFPDNPYAQGGADKTARDHPKTTGADSSSNRPETSQARDFIEDHRIQAIEFVKNYPLGQARGTIAQWLQYSFLSPGNEERWDAGAVEANGYVVTYRVFKSGRSDRASQVINYNFEVDLARHTILGTNPEAKELLVGTEPAARQAAAPTQSLLSAQPLAKRAAPRKRVKNKRAKKKPRKAAARIRPAPVPQLPLPEEGDATPPAQENNVGDISPTTLEFNP